MYFKNDFYEFLFIHVPKCAGTRIESFFGRNYDNIHIHKYIEIEYEKYHRKHMTLKNYEEFLGIETLNKMFKFSFVRNPFSLLVSSYNYNINSRNVFWNGSNDKKIKEKITFKSYLNSLLKSKNREIENKLHKLNTQPYSINKWILGNETELDFIGKVENFDNDFKKVCDIINIRYKKLGKINDNKEKVNYKDYYDDDDKRIVYYLFEDELNKFNYEF